ncbi:MAG: nucleotidyltransferase [Phycisphaerales bacterium JB039]
METQLPHDFKEFLRLLSSEKIEYLVVGGYAVSYHGYPRPTGDLDIWIAIAPENAEKLVGALAKFGFGGAGATTEMFLTPGRVVRMGVPPVRIEILSSISGVEFSTCFARRINATIDGVSVNVIAREDLLANKRSAGRAKDLNDLQHLDRPDGA